MSRKSLILVIIQFSCLIYFISLKNFITNDYLILIQILGFLVALWGLWVMKIGNFNIQPEVKSNAIFIKKGPYKIIRNPMYFGLITFFGAVVLNDHKPINLFFYIMLCIVLVMKIQMEETFLQKRFGVTYQEYKKTTYRLFPYIY